MLKKKDKEFQVYSRRALLVGALQGGALLGLSARMAWLQIVHGDKYKTLAEKNRINVKLLIPKRGLITDRYGTPLARNDQNFRVLVIPEQTHDLKEALFKLGNIIEVNDYDVENVLENASKRPAYLPLEIRDNLTWEEVSKIEVNIPELPGVSTNVGTRRSYPMDDATAHLVGYVGAVSKNEVGDNHLLSLPGFKIGKSGIEKTYDKELRGEAGRAEVEVNVDGREVRELSRKSAKTGEEVVLSVDAHLQETTQQRLSKTRSASAVIMDAYTGAIYALASSPGFNPNDFTKGITTQQWEELLSNPAHPLTNKAVAGQYPPGSTFKMITALAAMEKGIITPGTSFECTGRYHFGRDRFHCWKEEGHGRMNLKQAIAQSCDVYFYNIATKIGIDNIAEMARRFGLGERLGIELSAERPGVVPDKEWKLGFVGKPWQPGETIVASIGQGFLQATPLQLAVMTSRLVNGGQKVLPWLTIGVGGQRQQKQEWPRVNISKRDLDIIKKAMDEVTMGAQGTARGSRIYENGFEMGGKTGTSQVRRITQQERDAGIKNEDMPWRLRHHALFVGYAPISNPRYVCSVVVEHGGGGSTAAAPIARDLLLETQKRNPAMKSIILDENKIADHHEKLSGEMPGKDQE